jgi:hypothetical protein
VQNGSCLSIVFLFLEVMFCWRCLPSGESSCFCLVTVIVNLSTGFMIFVMLLETVQACRGHWSVLLVKGESLLINLVW